MARALPTIVWDLDDVLNDFTRAWLDSWRHEHPRSTVRYEQLTNPAFETVLGISRGDYLHSIDGFRAGSGRNLPLPDDVNAWFQRHGARARHVVLTARPRTAAAEGARWALHHLGDWVRGVHFVPSARADDAFPSYDLNKSNWLTWFDRADLFIDDAPENLAAVERLGIPTLTIPQPWNGARGSRADALERILDVLPLDKT